MTFLVSNINGGVMTLTVTDKASGNVEATTVWPIPTADNRDYLERTVRIADRISEGQKTLKLLFNTNQASWVCNYKAPTFTKYAENSASISALKVNGETAAEGNGYDWAMNIPNIYADATVKLAPEAKNATVTATAKDAADNDIAVTANADGTFAIPVPAAGQETFVTFTIAPVGDNVLPVEGKATHSASSASARTR